MAKQVYGTIRRVLSDGSSGTPWIAELMQSSGEGIAYLEMEKAPAAGVGDDILAMAELTRHRDGRLLAKSVGLDPQHAAALRRLRSGMNGSGLDAEWKVLSGIVAAEMNGDVRIGADASAISVIRPFAAASPARQMLSRHPGQGVVGNDAPRYVLDPIVYATPGDKLDRKKNALPAGVSNGRAERRGPSMTPTFGPAGETRAWLMYFGEVENCSYTKLSQISGRGMLPRHDISPALAHEFLTLHEYAHTLDDGMSGLRSVRSPHELRRMEAFADAFAVTELVMAGRNPGEIERIVACREAAIVGLSFLADGRRRAKIGDMEHFSGAAARVALTEAAAAVGKGRRANTSEMVRQAHRISERYTLGDDAMRYLQSSLNRLSGAAVADEMRQWLVTLGRGTKDPTLRANAASLHRQLHMFYVPGQQAEAADRIAAVHATSLRRHLEYARENGLDALSASVVAEREAEAWSVGNEGFFGRTLRRLVPGSASGLNSRISATLSLAASDASPAQGRGAVLPAISKLPVPASDLPNPWTYSVSGRLQQCAAYATEAYRVIAAVAIQGVPSEQHQQSFTNAMRGLSAFVDAVTLRDATKDGKSVRKRFDENPELEDYLRMIAAYRYSDLRLPVDEGKRLQLQSVILAIDPQADLPEMPRPVAESQIPEFGAGIFPAGERE